MKANANVTQLEEENQQLRAQVARLEQELAASQQEATRLQLAIDQMPVLIDAIDEQGTITLWNSECERVTGYRADEIINNPEAMNLLYPDESYRQELWQRWAEAGENFRNVVAHLTCKDGSTRAISWSQIVGDFPIPEWRTRAVGVDVTEQVRREREIATVFNSSYQFMALLHPDGTLQKINQAITQVTGLQTADIGPVPFWEAPWWPDDATRLEVQALIARAHQGEAIQYQANVIVREEQRLDVDFSVRPVYDELGAILFLLVEGRDITAQKRAEDDIRVYQQLVENAVDGIATFNSEGVITYANAAYNHLLGFDSAVGLSGTDITPPDQKERIAEIATEIAQHGAYQGSYVYQRKDGSTIPVQISVFIMSQDPSKPVLAAAIASDISERVRWEQELHTYQQLVENAADGIVTFTSDGISTYANAAFSRMLGYDHAVGLSGPGITPLDQQWRMAEVGEAVAQHGSYQGSYTYQRKDGSTFPAQISVFTITSDTNSAMYAAVIVRDVSERVRWEQELHTYQQLVENATDGIAIVNEDGIITYANAAYNQLLGYDSAVGLANTDVTPPTEAWRISVVYTELENHGSYEGSYSYKRKDGSTFPAQLSAFLMKTDKDNAMVAAAIVRDISERVQRETELRRIRAAVESSSDAVGIADLDGTSIYHNPAFVKLLGYTPDELNAAGGPTVTYADPTKATEVFAALGEGKMWAGEIEIRTKDGRTAPTLVRGNIIRGESGEPLGILGIVTDITERKRQEAERAMLQQQVIEAQRDTLRELSTPLIPITDDVVIMPLIGAIDSLRAQQVMEALLEGVARYQANLVILDITGVQVVDTQVAQAFIQAAQAVRLLGARVMITGIQPQIAQTLVQLGVDMSEIATRGSLQSGIAAALHVR